MASNASRRVRRNQIGIVVVVIAIVAVIAGLYGYMRHVAAARAAMHKHSFFEYVTTHHLGTLTTIDSGTGIDPVSYVLTVNHSIPDNQRASEALDLCHLYWQYDHGQALTIVYVDPATHKQYPIAETSYNDDERRLTLIITDSTGQAKTMVKNVDW